LNQVGEILEENKNQIKAFNLARKWEKLKTWVEAATNNLSEFNNAITVAKNTIDDTTGNVSDDQKKAALEPALDAAENALKTANAFLPEAHKNGEDGEDLNSESFVGNGLEDQKKGLYALEKADLFNLLCIPPFSFNGDGDFYTSLIDAAVGYCRKRRAFFIIDPPSDWRNKDNAINGINDGIGRPDHYAAVYFPRLIQPNPLRDNQIEKFAPCGAIAGVFARTDAQRGVWKAPAGLEATLSGVPQLSVPLTDDENGELNQLGINCLRAKPPAGRIVWGARTRAGDDRLASEWKYVPVRRTALFIEESLFRGSQWIVFEPNDEPLWAQIRLNFGAFMNNLFRQGAFQGSTPRDAYFVKCDKETTTQNDINLGIVNIIVGFAPLKPAEFVVIKLQQMAGQIDV
jgi:phage tail sheath protein FI